MNEKEFGAELLTGNRHSDCVLGHCNRAVSDKAVESQTGNMQHIGGFQDYCPFLLGIRLVLGTVVLVDNLTVFVPIDFHLVRHQRIQGHDRAFAVSDDLCIRISP